jgi:hypothetical protein
VYLIQKGAKQEDFEMLSSNIESKMFDSTDKLIVDMVDSVENNNNEDSQPLIQIEPPLVSIEQQSHNELNTPLISLNQINLTTKETVTKDPQLSPQPQATSPSTPIMRKTLPSPPVMSKSATVIVKQHEPKALVTKSTGSTVFKKPAVPVLRKASSNSSSIKSGGDGGSSSGRPAPPQHASVKYISTPTARANVILQSKTSSPVASLSSPQSNNSKPPVATSLIKAAQKKFNPVPRINLLFSKNSASKQTPKVAAAVETAKPLKVVNPVVVKKTEGETGNSKQIEKELSEQVVSLRRELESVRQSADRARELYNEIKTEFESWKLGSYQTNAQIKILEFNLEEERRVRVEFGEKLDVLMKK